MPVYLHREEVVEHLPYHRFLLGLGVRPRYEITGGVDGLLFGFASSSHGDSSFLSHRTGILEDVDYAAEFLVVHRHVGVSQHGGSHVFRHVLFALSLTEVHIVDGNQIELVALEVHYRMRSLILLVARAHEQLVLHGPQYVVERICDAR